jgi:hypothetical protein
MTAREKTLGAVVAAMVGCFLIYAVVSRALLGPIREAEDTARRLESDIDELQRANDRAPHYKHRLGALVGRTFGGNELEVRERVRARLMELANLGGVDTRKEWDLTPISGGRKRDVYREAGWAVSARGSLENVVNFLYLLSADHHLHRLSGLSLRGVRRTRDVVVNVRYTTLVLEGSANGASDATPTTLPSLEDGGRDLYQAIVARDLMRPYVKRRVAQRPEPPRPPRPQQPQGPPDPPPETWMRVVSLSQMADQPHVCIRDTRSGELRFFKRGDPLAGGTLVMVDYRPMPRTDTKLRILSESRLILDIDSTFWAVELGQTLAQRRRLTQGQLPSSLQGPVGALPQDDKAVSPDSERG